jgi:hypothetical protein
MLPSWPLGGSQVPLPGILAPSGRRKVGRPPSLKGDAVVATFLASDDSAYMSGLIIPACDGGNFAKTSIPFPKTWSLEEMTASALDEPAS